ncbi:hypothetical protein PSACC_01738 [Paramicrosporidium saccamoebae]|uniref:Uncharacterized protein n=1 Tax=Paramicrosporidium saccamoebae TaxID=1246581 RepID=A0A2H9TL02_9FUNG|nr:hypothetical protein PSACC_01738 [Paramicrosporidium saccamoebae]
MIFLWFLVFAGSIQSALPESFLDDFFAQDNWSKGLEPYEDIFADEAYAEGEFSFLEGVRERKEPEGTRERKEPEGVREHKELEGAREHKELEGARERKEPVPNHSTLQKDTLSPWEQPLLADVEPPRDERHLFPSIQQQQEAEPWVCPPAATRMTNPPSNTSVPYQPPASSSGTLPPGPEERVNWFLEDGKPFVDFQANTMGTQSSAVFSQISYYGAIKPGNLLSYMFGSNAAMGYRATRDRILLLDGYKANNPAGESLFSAWAADNLNEAALKSEPFLHGVISDKSLYIVATILTKQIPQAKETVRELEKSSGLVTHQPFRPSSVPSPTKSAERALWFLEGSNHYKDHHIGTQDTTSLTVFGYRLYEGAVENDRRLFYMTGSNTIMGYQSLHLKKLGIKSDYSPVPQYTLMKRRRRRLPGNRPSARALPNHTPIDSPFETSQPFLQDNSRERANPYTSAATPHQEMSNSSRLVTHQPSSPPSVAERALWFLEGRSCHKNFQTSIQDTTSSTVFGHRFYKGVVGLEKHPFHMAGSDSAMGYQVAQDRILVSDGYRANSPARENILTWGTNALSEATMEIQEFCRNKSLCIVAVISNNPTPQSRETNDSPRHSPAPNGKTVERVGNPSPISPQQKNVQPVLVSNDSSFEGLRASSQASGQDQSRPRTRAYTLRKAAKASGLATHRPPSPSNKK